MEAVQDKDSSISEGATLMQQAITPDLANIDLAESSSYEKLVKLGKKKQFDLDLDEDGKYNAEYIDFSDLAPNNKDLCVLLRKFKLEGSNFYGLHFSKLVLINCDLKAVTFEGCKFGDALIYNCDCRDADFEGVDLQKTKIHFTKISGANFSFANLSGKNLGCDLKYVNFTGADLRECVFRKAKFQKTCFRDADLRGAFLTCPLLGGDFSRADLKDAHLPMFFDIGLHKHLSKEEASKPEPIFHHADLRGASPLGGILKYNNSLQRAKVTWDQLKEGRLGEDQIKSKGLLTPLLYVSYADFLCSGYIREGIKEVSDERYGFGELQCELNTLTIGFYFEQYSPKSISPQI